MYKTIKIRLRINQQQKQVLLTYETICHQEIKRIMQIMHSMNKFLPLAYYKISDEIQSQSKWYLYQFAKQQVIRRKAGKKILLYHKSSSWNPASLKICEKKLYLFYGRGVIDLQEGLCLVIDDVQRSLLDKGKIQRLDIVHDELYWFANLLIQTKK